MLAHPLWLILLVLLEALEAARQADQRRNKDTEVQAIETEALGQDMNTM